MRKIADDHGEKRVLRRRSFLLMSWVFTLSFGFAAIAGARMASEVNGGPLAGSAACFGTIAVVRRIFGSKIILDEQLIIVNPIFTHRFPYRTISDISSRNGILTVTGNDGSDIRSTAFGGSIIDLLFNTTDGAVIEINKRRRVNDSRWSVGFAKRNVTRSWVADISLALSMIFAAMAAIIGV